MYPYGALHLGCALIGHGVYAICTTVSMPHQQHNFYEVDTGSPGTGHRVIEGKGTQPSLQLCTTAILKMVSTGSSG